VTKDELVHARECTGGEHWIHAVLFLVHPVALLSIALLWPALHPISVPWTYGVLGGPPSAVTGDMRGLLTLPPGLGSVLVLQFVLTAMFCVYQTVYWNISRDTLSRSRAQPTAAGPGRTVNNRIYDSLAERWYKAQDDPVALLRAESRLRAPWIAEQLKTTFSGRPARVLDVGCGAGFLSNALAKGGHDVTGVDVSAGSLAVARAHDETRSARYLPCDARHLPFGDAAFDCVCAMDMLEHVEDPAAVIHEAARVLAPGGLFFFYTFNRNFLSWLVVIKGVELFVKNTPCDLHVLRLFLTPAEVRAMCAASGLSVRELRGCRPKAKTRALLELATTGTVPEDFEFCFTKSTRLAYAGVAVKDGPQPGPQATRARAPRLEARPALGVLSLAFGVGLSPVGLDPVGPRSAHAAAPLVARAQSGTFEVTAAAIAAPPTDPPAQPVRPRCAAWFVEYTLAASLRLSDTPLGRGDGVYRVGPGALTLRFEDQDGRPGGSVKMVSYEVKQPLSIVSTVLFWKTTVTSDTTTRKEHDSCSMPPEGRLAGTTLTWDKAVPGFRSDGTVRCEGTFCGRYGAPPAGSTPFHIAAHASKLEPFQFSADMSSFTMPWMFVAKTDVPKQTAHLALSGREARRTCAAAAPCP
jgi:2-polyprenyl-6-hydroxyphenyl methylase/3-demethylubiquinone-9 3-methyltransferase